MVITIYLLKEKKTKREHLIYIINNILLIDPTFRGLVFNDIKLLEAYIKVYEVIDYKIVDIDEMKRKPYMKLSFYNCISFGKQLLGMSGIYFKPHSFFNKIKE